jgi:hypothetical protein
MAVPDGGHMASCLAAFVTHTVDGEEIAGPSGIWLDLASDVLDVRVDGPVEGFALLTAHGVQKLRAREHPAWMPGKGRQQLEFGRRQIDRPSSARRHHPRNIQGEILDTQLRGFLPGRTCTPQDRLHAGDELAGTERFGDVVVGADAEPANAIRLFDSGGQLDDRHGRLVAKPFRHVEAVHARQPEVQHDQVRMSFARERQRALAGGCRQDGKPGVAQVIINDLR